MSKLDRRSFLKTAGVATGVAVVGGVPAVAAAATESRPEIVLMPAPLTRSPIVAYVRDARRNEVTIVSGLHETTFRDPQLVKRLQKAAGANGHNPRRRWGVM